LDGNIWVSGYLVDREVDGMNVKMDSTKMLLRIGWIA
jgi:hypothetical protein